MNMVPLRLKQMVTDGLSLDATINRVYFPERGDDHGDSSSKGAEYCVTGNTSYGTGDNSRYGCFTVRAKTSRTS